MDDLIDVKVGMLRSDVVAIYDVFDKDKDEFSTANIVDTIVYTAALFENNAVYRETIDKVILTNLLMKIVGGNITTNNTMNEIFHDDEILLVLIEELGYGSDILVDFINNQAKNNHKTIIDYQSIMSDMKATIK